MIIKRFFSCTLIILMVTGMVVPLVFAAPPKYEKVLEIVSGSNSDLGTLSYGGHTVSDGFAVSVSMMASVDPNVCSFSRAAFAVSLGSWWSEGIYSYKPRVSEMWVNITGDSNYRVFTGGIADNTGASGNCTESWQVLLAILEVILPYLLEMLAQEPPLTEWQDDLHWAKAIVRSEAPYEGGHVAPTYIPGVETAGCDFLSLFLQEGYQYLTITAGADICVVRSWWSQGDYLYWSVIPVGTYSVSFTIEVPVTNVPGNPPTPSGSTSGYVYTTYTYSTSTTDPNDDDVRYEFWWGDGSTTTTGWYASGFTANASHYWSSPGTKYVKVRAQDSYYEYSDWSPYLTVSISSGGGGGCPILSVYDGAEFALEGLLDIHNPDREDVVASHVLIHTPEPAENRYLLRLTEHPQTHSHIDQVQLFATLTNGTEIKLPLVSAIHSEDGNVKQKLLLSDDVRADTLGADHNNGTSQYIDLKFVTADELEIQQFTFIIEGHNRIEKIP